MQLSSQIQYCIELLDMFFESKAPFDVLMANFFKNNKWIGSKDRRAVAEFLYAIFRNYETISFFTSNITEKFGRFYILTFLKVIQKATDISQIFSGKKHHPSVLTDFEKRFLDDIDLTKTLPINVRLNYPAWMTTYFQKAFSNFEDELMAFNQKAYVDLRVNTLKSSIEKVKHTLSQEGVVFENAKYSVNGIRILDRRISRSHEIIKNGFAEIQDEGSQLVAQICSVNPHDTVIDFCAGAGGKTLALAATMQNKGRIFALDKSEKRLQNAKIRLRKAGVNNVFCQEINSKWLKRHQECADLVLVDAPCSGTGTWRRNPDMRARFCKNDLDEILILQFNILTSAQKLVKNGGRLVYATCSVLKEENEEQIEKFTTKFPEFKVKPISLSNLKSNGACLSLSPFRNKTDGFFAALLEKTCSN